MREKDEANLQEIILCVDKIWHFLEGVNDAKSFNANEEKYDAVMMNFILIGAAVSRLSDELKVEHSFVEWNKIKSFRNLVVHDYLGVDEDEVWDIIQHKLLKLKTDLQNILSTK